nr:MAG TPA: hypothetical protein [Caudoviricetes sp.]
MEPQPQHIRLFLIRCLLFPDNFKISRGASFPFFLIFNLLFWYTKF